MDALRLLKADHDKVKNLLEELESTTERGVTCELGTNRLVGTDPEALASAIATDRCLPPVQPIASVR